MKTNKSIVKQYISQALSERDASRKSAAVDRIGRIKQITTECVDLMLKKLSPEKKGDQYIPLTQESAEINLLIDREIDRVRQGALVLRGYSRLDENVSRTREF